MTLERRPSFARSHVEQIVSERFGIDGSASALPSDRDQNFKLVADDGNVFVVKIASQSTGSDRVGFENELLEAAAAGPLPMATPQIVPDTSKNKVVRLEFGGQSFLTRLLTWVDGVPLANFRPHTRELFFEIGEGLGRLSAVLARCEKSDSPAAPEWNLREARRVVLERFDILETDKRSLVERHLERFTTDTAPNVDQLPIQLVHNDANDYNVLVDVGPNRHPTFAGLIDFGDADPSWRVADVAIACAYGMLDKPDPIEAAEAIVAGFHSARSLTEDETAALFDLICMRLCVSVVLSSSRLIEEPDNEYYQISAAPAWRLLEQLDRVHPRLATYRLRSACGMEAVPAAPSIRDWLKANAETFTPICEVDLDNERLTVLDLTPGSTDPVIMTDEQTASKVIFDRIEAVDHVAAIGRYNEARLVYDGPQFSVETWNGPEFRTVHLGIDVFRSPGSPVFAPLAGTVHLLETSDEKQSYGVVVVLKHALDDCLPFFTLYGHLSRTDLELHEVGDRVEAGGLVGTIGRPDENGGWTPHLHFQIVTDLLDSSTGFPGVAHVGQRSVWLSLCPDPNVILRIAPHLLETGSLSPPEVIERRDRYIAPSLSLSYREPLNIVRGIGTTLFDHEGRRYLDCVNNVCHVGHSHPAVVEAAAGQMRVLNTNTRYLHENLVRYAERLTAKLPDRLDTCYFVNSGSEANDLAIRLAVSHTHCEGIVVFEGAYHGHLSSLIRVSPYKFDGPGGRGKPEGTFVAPMPDAYRGRHRGSGAAGRYAEDFEATIEEARRSGGATAFLFESMLSCGGQIDPPAGFLQAACRHAREAGLVCIADEVQTGFGRVGDAFWGFARHGLEPDIVTMGKAIGNGHPLAAVVTTREIAASFADGMEYFNTFGGNPVSCAVGLAVLDVIEREQLQEHARTTGDRLKKALKELAERHPVIGDVRGSGLFLGFELVIDRETREPATGLAAYLENRARELGVLLSTDGPHRNVIKIKPPLVFDDADSHQLVSTLDRVLDETVFRV